MKVDWDELKRLHEARLNGYSSNHAWFVAPGRSFPQILAEREAAQRLRDRAEDMRDRIVEHFGTEGIKQWPSVYRAVVDFDKETQND